MRAKRPSERELEARRRERHPWRNWYKLTVWPQLRAAQLAKQPLCERCDAEGSVVAATVVNDRTPHRGVWSLFVDPDNLESVCKPHHDSDVQSEERRAGR